MSVRDHGEASDAARSNAGREATTSSSVDAPEVASTPTGRTTRRGLLALQRGAGNRAVAAHLAVQRDGPDTLREHVIPINLATRHGEELRVRTVSDMATAYSDISSEMFFAEREVIGDREQNPHSERWDREQDFMDELARTYRDWHAPNDAPDPQEIGDLRGHVRTVENLARQAYNHYRSRVATAVGQARAAAERAHEKAQSNIRAAFLSGASDDHPHLTKLWEVSNSTQSLVTGLAGALSEEGTTIRGLSTITGRAFTLANLVVGWAEESPSTFGTGFEGMAALRNLMAVTDAAGSFAGVPLSLVTGHIGPALQAIDGAMGRLAGRMREINDDWAAFDGRPAYPGAEPGGIPMWNFMVAIMQGETPTSVPDTVFDYFDGMRDRLDRFVTAAGGEAMPSESWMIFGSQADRSRLPGWVSRNRAHVWPMLYGSRDPSRARRYSN